MRRWGEVAPIQAQLLGGFLKRDRYRSAASLSDTADIRHADPATTSAEHAALIAFSERRQTFDVPCGAPLVVAVPPDGGSPDAKEFGELGLGVVPRVVQFKQVPGLVRLQLRLLAAQPG
jgi:hypothetical protein